MTGVTIIRVQGALGLMGIGPALAAPPAKCTYPAIWVELLALGVVSATLGCRHTGGHPEGERSMGVTSELSRFSADISLDKLPPEVTTRARFLVLDLVGNIVRARHDAESTASFLAATRAMGMAAGNAGVFGDAARYTPAGAAFLNGALAHSLDFDDTHAAGSLHPGAASRRHACRRSPASVPAPRSGTPHRPACSAPHRRTPRHCPQPFPSPASQPGTRQCSLRHAARARCC